MTTYNFYPMIIGYNLFLVEKMHFGQEVPILPVCNNNTSMNAIVRLESFTWIGVPF